MIFNPTKIARQDILSLFPYQGRSEEKGPEDSLICLDFNESPFAGVDINRYPGSSIRTLNARLSELYKVEQNQLLISLGSDDGINTIIRAFCEAKEDSILICPPTFAMYEISATIQGATTLSVPIGKNLIVDFNAIQTALNTSPKTKVVFLCSPQNPTGSALPFDKITSLAQKNQNSLIVVDEAYQEFSLEPSLINAVEKLSLIHI